MKISVIIPFYNSEKYLEEAVNSVLRQNTEIIEILLIDDGSEDNSLKVAEKFLPQVNIFRQHNSGAAAARNYGVNQSKGDIIAFLDADDIWTDHHLEVLVKPLLTQNHVEIVFGKIEAFISPELIGQVSVNLDSVNNIEKGYLPQSCIIRKSVFNKIGYMDSTLELGEFIDWFSRAKDSGVNYVSIPEVVTYRRIHKTNQGMLKKAHYRDYLKLLHSSIARKKSQVDEASK